jgi:glycosyltransferase involved in cell wall biosynthesis
MLLVGDGPLRAELEALAAELGIAERVRFAGHSNEVPVALRASRHLRDRLEVRALRRRDPRGQGGGPAIVATRVNEIPEILAG